MRFVTGLAILAGVCALNGPGNPPVPLAQAQDNALPVTAAGDYGAGFQSYLNTVRAKAQAAGVGDDVLDATLPGLQVNPRVITLDRNQPGGPIDSPIPDFEPYRKTHVNGDRIAGGRAARVRNAGHLDRIVARTGVPASVLLAIYGHETNYGRYTGDFDLVRSLATLAYEGRRRALFEPELIAALSMMSRGVPRERLVGSWAGATGFPQFLPSVYLLVARDGDGDGHADIWSSEADALASIAQYFVDAGWRSGEPWGVAVRVPDGLDRTAFASRFTPPRCPRVFGRHSRWMTVAQWRAAGIVVSDGRGIDDLTLATLLEPDGPGKTAYLLTGNYRAILDYNCSNFYALSVGLLADAIDDQK